MEPGWSPAVTARHTVAATLAGLAVVVIALALWKLRVVLALILLGLTIAAAMRPGIDRLASLRVPRAIGLILHYAILLGLVALFLAFVVPQLTDQVQAALHTAQTHHPTGGGSLKERLLDEIQRRLHHLPSAGKLVQPAVSVGEQALKVLVGIFFTFSIAAYWIFERDRTVDAVTSLLPRPRRKKVRDTWTLIDQKLGAFVRGELVLIAFVSTLASFALWLVHEPYWLIIGIAVGILEIIPVIGPLAALAVAVAAGLTSSWHTAVFAGAALLLIRVLEDYLVTPRVLGGAVGLSPLLTLVAVSATGVLFGGFYVLLAVPIASLVATVLDVAVRGVEPTEVEIPTVIFTSQQDQSSG